MGKTKVGQSQRPAKDNRVIGQIVSTAHFA
jgi:hypothetical protein